MAPRLGRWECLELNHQGSCTCEGVRTGPGGVDEDAGEEEDDSDPENEWHTSDDGEETFQIDDDPNAGPIGAAFSIVTA